MTLAPSIIAIVNYPSPSVVRLVQKGDPCQVQYADLSSTSTGKGTQMIGYLAITGLHLALLVNFKEAKLQWKRVVRTGTVEGTVD